MTDKELREAIHSKRRELANAKTRSFVARAAVAKARARENAIAAELKTLTTEKESRYENVLYKMRAQEKQERTFESQLAEIYGSISAFPEEIEGDIPQSVKRIVQRLIKAESAHSVTHRQESEGNQPNSQDHGRHAEG